MRREKVPASLSAAVARVGPLLAPTRSPSYVPPSAWLTGKTEEPSRLTPPRRLYWPNISRSLNSNGNLTATEIALLLRMIHEANVLAANILLADRRSLASLRDV